MMPDLQILLEGPHLISIFSGCSEIQICGRFLHILFGKFNGFLHLLPAHGTDYRILEHRGKVGLDITVNIGGIAFPLRIMPESDTDRTPSKIRRIGNIGGSIVRICCADLAGNSVRKPWIATLRVCIAV